MCSASASKRSPSLRSTWTGAAGSGRRSTVSVPPVAALGMASPPLTLDVVLGCPLRQAARPAQRRGRRAGQEQQAADREDGGDLLLALLRPDARAEPLIDALELV